MKQLLSISLILCFNFFFSFAQTDLKKVLTDIQQADSVVCFGLDFSNAKFIGYFPDKKKIIDSLLIAWNSMLVSSDMLKSYRTKPFLYDFSVISYRNKQLKENDLFTSLPLSLTPDRIQLIINDYNPIIKNGKGLVFIVESFDKNREEAKICLTYFNIASKQVLFTQTFVGYAYGVGMVNHWGIAIHQVILTSTFHPLRNFTNAAFIIIFAVSLTVFVLLRSF